MRLHLIESDQRALQTAECAFASLVLHTSLIWLIVGVLISGPGLPAAVRDTAALFLVPPDRKESPPAGQTARFQIGQQRGDRPIRFGGVLRVIGFDVAVRVPGVDVLIAHAAVEQLHEADAVLDQPPRHQTLPAERLGDRIVEAVEVARRF